MAEPSGPISSILIVDGEVLVRHAIADYLRGCGFTVIEAASTDEALTVLRDPDILVDVLLCDAQAPGTIGAFMLRRAAIELPHRGAIKVLLAGSVDAEARKAAELCEEGPDLARPYDPQSLTDHIRRLLGTAPVIR